MTAKPEMTPGPLRLDDQRRELFGLVQAMLPVMRGDGPRGEGPWVVMVCGVEGGEGATTVARNLADLVSREFAAPVCLLRIAAGDPPANGALPAPRQTSSPEDGADILTVEISQRGLAEALSAGFRQSLGRITQYAGIFLIDGPPILDSLDAARLCREVDGLILVAEAERTSPAAVDAARAAVEGFGGRLIGGVLNKRRRRLPRFLAVALGGIFRPRLGGTIEGATGEKPS